MEMNYVEIVGYTASVLVAISIMMKSIVKLRIVNLIGSLVFGTYGVLIGAIPVAFVNYFISVVNIYYLVKMYKEHKKSLM